MKTIVAVHNLKFQKLLIQVCSDFVTALYVDRLYRNRLASRSDSSRVRMSPVRTGPLMFRIIARVGSLTNSTLTCVHCPCEPVRPNTLRTRAKITGFSIVMSAKQKRKIQKSCLQFSSLVKSSERDNKL